MLKKIDGERFGICYAYSDQNTYRELGVRKLFKVHWMVLLLLLSGCAHSVPVFYFSRPETISVSNDAFDARIQVLMPLS